jgi:ABC-2 type transport system ATP-binding protein
MIHLDGLCVAYGERLAVRDVSGRVAPGEFFGLLGSNGAGKTSVLAALCGLIRPTAGRVAIDGLDPYRERTRVARRLGLVPQELAFYPALTARQNLVFFGRVHGLNGAALRAAVDRVLARVQLADRADDRAHTFSGGMKRRLNLAIGLLHEPAVLVLDEPTAGIDAQSRHALLECFAAVGRAGTTVLYTTHLMEEAERLCDRVAIMDGGRFVAVDTPAALIARHGTGALRVDFDRPPPAALADHLVAAGLVREVRRDGARLDLVAERPERVLAELRERSGDAGIVIESFEQPRPSLELVYLSLTGKRMRDGVEA